MDNQSSFFVIDNVLSTEDCKALTDIVLNNTKGDHDKYPLFDWMEMPSFHILAGLPQPWDRDAAYQLKLKKIIELAYDFFVENYELTGVKFGLNRIHGNVMHKDSFFITHRDEQPNDKGVYDGQKKTYVAALFLNDDYEGGNYYFEDQNAEFKPEVGSLVLFPGYCTPHEIKQITEGTRVNVLIVFYDYLQPDYENNLVYYEEDGALIPSPQMQADINLHKLRAGSGS